MKTGIPSSFKLAGHTIQVSIVSPAKWKHGKKNIGMFLPDVYRIEIVSTTKGTNRQQTFTHELVHALLTIAGHDDMSNNEDFVDRLGHLLHQAMTTFE